MSSYRYQSLPQGHIRLLELLPGDNSSPLSGAISSACLDDAPEYEAVSYAWSSPDFTDGLSICSIPITTHLSKLLRALRLPDATRTLWIDAICVNQADIQERSAQVQVMKQIYTRAMRVVIWLGEQSPDGSSDRALGFLKKMAMHRKYYGRGHWIGSERQGSAASSECGVGRRGDMSHDEKDEDDEDDDWAMDSDATSEKTRSDSHETDASAGSSQQNNAITDMQRIRNRLQTLFSDCTTWLAGLIRKLRWRWMYLRRQTWNPIQRWQDTRRWGEIMDAMDQNRSHFGHIQFGFPILHESDMGFFFQDKFQQDWEALDALLTRRWWTRTWVVQEVWCSSNQTILQCGRTAIKWKTLQKALDYEEAWDEMGGLIKGTSREAVWKDLRRRYGLAIHLSKKRLMDCKISDLLWNTWDREATDPRDKVFAMLALASRDENSFPKAHGHMLPDYGMTVTEVYTNAARDIILVEKSLDILLAAGGRHAQLKDTGLPSWVPDWRPEASASSPKLFVNRSRISTLYFTSSMNKLIVNGHGYAACGDTPSSASFSIDGRSLYAMAILIDEVGDAGIAHGAHPTAADAITNARTVVERAGAMNRLSEASTLKNDDIVNSLRRILAAGSTGVDPGDLAIENTVGRRRFFVSASKKLFGVGPAEARKGDKIFILAGCNFPLILREVSRKAIANGYQLVGEAYVHGIMAGEEIASLKRQPWWLRWFRQPKPINWQEICIE